MSEWKDTFGEFKCVLKLKDAERNGLLCKGCKDGISKEKKRIEFTYSNRYGGLNTFRLCEDCILELGEMIKDGN